MVWTSDSGSSQPNDRDRIAALETTVADLQQRLTALEGAGAATTSPYGAQQPAANDALDPWTVTPWPEIVHLLQTGKKIQGIKVYKDYFRVGLQEAKDAVDEVERRIRG